MQNANNMDDLDNIKKRSYEDSFIPTKYVVEKNCPFVFFNFRGQVSFIGKDLVELVPYLNALCGTMSNSPRDDNGYLMIDEHSDVFFSVLDKYREWLETDKPNGFSRISDRGLLVSLARRMAFDEEFTIALSTKNVDMVNKDKLYTCYYCDQIFLKGEKAEMNECRYHEFNCGCSNPDKGYSKCRRLPYHSKVELDIVKHQPYRRPPTYQQ